MGVPFLSRATTLTRTSSVETWIVGVPGFSGSCAAKGETGEERAAAMSMATSFRVGGIVIGSQKRKRAWAVMRRMLPTEVTSPKVSEFTAVLMEAKFT